jgi:predicted flavoprotein YhiN
MGFHLEWSAHMAPHMGQPVKAVALIAAGERLRGEFVISQRGIEGGGIYALSRPLREGAALHVDLFPDLGAEALAARLRTRPARESTVNRLRKALNLGGARLALALEWGRPLPADHGACAARLKALPVPLGPPRPMDEAISTAGGLPFAALDAGLMLHAKPGVFACGEMLDWEAPTGGYLLTASLATGQWAGRAAARWVKNSL